MQGAHIDLSNPTPYIAPSWSPLRQAGIPCFDSINRHDISRADFVLVEGYTAVRGFNSFGQIQSGYLLIQGKFMRLSGSDQFHMMPLGYCRLWCIMEKGESFAYFHLDWSSGTPTMIPTIDFYMLVISSSEPQPLITSVTHALRPSRREGDRNLDESSEEDEHNTASDQDDSLYEQVMESWDDEHGSSNDSGDITHRDIYGLLLHPAQAEGQYFRIGVWTSQAVNGYGSRYFDHVNTQEVAII